MRKNPISSTARMLLDTLCWSLAAQLREELKGLQHIVKCFAKWREAGRDRNTKVEGKFWARLNPCRCFEKRDRLWMKIVQSHLLSDKPVNDDRAILRVHDIDLPAGKKFYKSLISEWQKRSEKNAGIFCQCWSHSYLGNRTFVLKDCHCCNAETRAEGALISYSCISYSPCSRQACFRI